MKLTKITNFTLWIKGTAPLPAGAVPLATKDHAGLVCLMPSGVWISWLAGVAKVLPMDTQKDVLNVIVDQMGGTAETMAGTLGVSKRTVEGWRARKSPLPISKAFEIAEILST